MNTILSKIGWSALLLTTLGLVACGEPPSTASEFNPSSEMGRLSFRMVDAPGDAAHLWVSVEQISLKNCGGGGWLEVPTVSTDFDLMALAGGDAFKTLSQAAFIPLGTYCETRLVLGEDATVETEDGEAYPLKVPSGESSGYKIKGEYEVRDDALTIVTLDFDAEKSLHKAGKSGKYILRPVVRIENVEYFAFPIYELHYSDFLRERLAEQGSEDTEVQVIMNEWVNIPTLRETLQSPGSPTPSTLYGRNSLPGGRLEPTLEVDAKGLPEQKLNAQLEKLASYAGPAISAEANAMALEGANSSLESFALRGHGSADDVLSWWNDHEDMIRLVQPILNDTDQAQQLFFPGSPVR